MEPLTMIDYIKTLREMMIEKHGGKDIPNVSESLEALWDGAFDVDVHKVVKEAIELGVLFMSDGLFQLCTELEWKRIEAAAKDPEKQEEKESEEVVAEPVVKDEPYPEDGPGEYFQVIIKDLGMAIVRHEEQPQDWHTCGDPNGLIFFEHFWFVHDETPQAKEVRNSQTGVPYHVSIPRLRYYKAARGAYLPSSGVVFSCWMDRQKDPLIQELMKTSHNVVNLAGGEEQS